MFGEYIEIPVVVTAEDQASPVIEQVNTQISGLNRTVGVSSMSTRTLGRDMMSLAFGVSFLARHLGVAGQALDVFLVPLMAVGVAFRTYAILNNIIPAIHSFSAATWVATLATHGLNMELLTQVALLSALTLGAAAGIAIVAYTAMQSQMRPIRSMQTGGYVPQTGLYLLHAGETVTPAGDSYTWVNMDNKFGAVSSNIDVDNMLDMMATRVATASRRRSGY
jgi:hypothetical protein